MVDPQTIPHSTWLTPALRVGDVQGSTKSGHAGEILWRSLAERHPADLMRRAAGYRKLAVNARTRAAADGFLALAQRYEKLADEQLEARREQIIR
jgi:hypothetical protein